MSETQVQKLGCEALENDKSVREEKRANERPERRRVDRPDTLLSALAPPPSSAPLELWPRRTPPLSPLVACVSFLGELQSYLEHIRCQTGGIE